jgi:hypothetical protein
VGHDNDYYIHGGLRKLKAYFINIYLWDGRAWGRKSWNKSFSWLFGRF